MAGHPDSIRTAFDIVRRGGRISLLGLTSKPIQLNFSEDIIFKGLLSGRLRVGRRDHQTKRYAQRRNCDSGSHASRRSRCCALRSMIF